MLIKVEFEAPAFSCAIPAVRAELFMRYARYRLFSYEEQEGMALIEIRRLLSDKRNIFHSFYSEGDFVGFSVVEFLTWDSSHFGMNMGRLHFFSVNFDFPLDAAIKKVFEDSVHAGFCHISASIGTKKSLYFNALLKNGFDFLDSKLFYLSRPFGAERDEARFSLRDYNDSDYETVCDLIYHADIPSRYSMDATLSAAKVSRMYIKWAETLLSERSRGGKAAVVIRNSKLAGFAGIREVRFPCSSLNGRLMGGSFLVCSKNRIGAAYPLVARGINEGLKVGRAVEFATSIDNLPMRRVLLHLGCEPVFSSYELRWSS